MTMIVQKHGYRGWQVMRDGLPISGRIYKLKRDAQAAIPQIEKSEAYTALCEAQDRAGVYEWTPDEEQQITEYAALLKENKPRWTFNGQHPIQDIGRQHQVKDQADLDKDREYWLDADLVYREKRRTMAARAEAYKRAGLAL